MYVHYQVPVGVLGVPITLIHGCCLTGKTWETTPDGRMGWDEYFVRRGHPTYVIDQVWRGRSAADPSAINAVRSGKAAVDQLPTVFSAGHESAWAIFRFGKESGCVKTPTFNLRVEHLSQFRRWRNQSHWQLLSGDDN